MRAKRRTTFKLDKRYNMCIARQLFFRNMKSFFEQRNVKLNKGKLNTQTDRITPDNTSRL